MADNPSSNLEPASLENLKAIVESYKEEFLVGEENDLARRAEKVFKDNVEAIAEEMVDIALHSADIATRQRAAKYVLDNVVFFTGKRTGGRDEFSDLLDKIKVKAADE